MKKSLLNLMCSKLTQILYIYYIGCLNVDTLGLWTKDGIKEVEVVVMSAIGFVKPVNRGVHTVSGLRMRDNQTSVCNGCG